MTHTTYKNFSEEYSDHLSRREELRWYGTETPEWQDLSEAIATLEATFPQYLQRFRQQQPDEPPSIPPEILAYCQQHGFTEPLQQDGNWWAFPPSGAMAIPLPRLSDLLASHNLTGTPRAGKSSMATHLVLSRLTRSPTSCYLLS